MITSTTNPLIKQIRRLQKRKYREREGLFVVEGIRIVLAALEQDATVEKIIIADSLLTSEVAHQRVNQWVNKTHGHVEMVSDTVFKSISERDNPTGIAALLTYKKKGLADIDATNTLVALHNVENPGNVGTILRTIDASGANGLILVGKTTDPTHATAIKASMGAWFNVPLFQAASLDELFTWASANGVTTVATSANTESGFRDVTEKRPILLLMGSEQKGLPDDALTRADQAIKIPMHGTSSSLNLAVATSILLFELNRI